MLVLVQSRRIRETSAVKGGSAVPKLVGGDAVSIAERTDADCEHSRERFTSPIGRQTKGWLVPPRLEKELVVSDALPTQPIRKVAEKMTLALEAAGTFLRADSENCSTISLAPAWWRRAPCPAVSTISPRIRRISGHFRGLQGIRPMLVSGWC